MILGVIKKNVCLHEDVKREMKRFEISYESSNGGKGAEIKMHDDDLRIRKLREDT